MFNITSSRSYVHVRSYIGYSRLSILWEIVLGKQLLKNCDRKMIILVKKKLLHEKKNL
jgi:hypothetical protein